MNPEAQAALDVILAKEPYELREDEKAFLRSRIAYLGRRSRQKFESILGEQPDKDVHLDLDVAGETTPEEVVVAPNPYVDNTDVEDEE